MRVIAATLAFLCLVAAVIAGIVGWVWNILAIIDATGFSGLLIARVIGVFVAPLGAVLGWFA